MAWNCIPFICLQVAGAESSQTCCLDTLQSQLAKSKKPPEEFCYKGSLTEFYQSFPFGTMLQRFDPTIPNAQKHSLNGEAWQTGCVSAEASPVRTSVAQEMAQDWTEKGLGCGVSLLASFAKYDPVTHSLKTLQGSLLWDLIESSVTLPQWGIMLDGVLSARKMPVQITNANGFGSKQCWPTPSASDHKGSGKTGQLRDRLDYAVERGATKSRKFPTPCAQDYKGRGPNSRQQGLCDVVRRKYYTPTAKDSSPASIVEITESRKDNPRRTVLRLRSQVTEPEDRGKALNPEWVEWLMGWPIGWTSLEPLREVILLDWSIDPADEQPARVCGTPRARETPRSPEFGKGRVPVPEEIILEHPAPDGRIPRVIGKIPNRAARIKMLGNGQVPQAAVLAWKIL